MPPRNIRLDTAGLGVITDLGRRRGPDVGLAVHGALDQFSARAANALVGNDENAAVLESTLLDTAFTPDSDVLMAVAGAGADIRMGGTPVRGWQPFLVPGGEQVSISGIRDGIRVYVAVNGGFRAAALMGSCAPEPALGFGGPLADGDTVPLNGPSPTVENPALGVVFFNIEVDRAMPGSRFDIPIVWGPDDHDFDGIGMLCEEDYEVGQRSNHVGLRLAGRRPARRSRAEVLSRGVPVGAVELPPGDGLLVLLRGRSVTAGYPVAAVATTVGQDLLGQLRPGEHVRFVAQELSQAAAEDRRRRDVLRSIRRRSLAALGALDPASVVPPPDDPATDRPTRHPRQPHREEPRVHHSHRR